MRDPDDNPAADDHPFTLLGTEGRGYCCVGLDHPKEGVNVGHALRACAVYGASMLVTSGERHSPEVATNTPKAHRHIPYVAGCDSVFGAHPYDCVPVAVERTDGSIPLPEYEHPKRAMYVFGAEDQTLGSRVTDQCRDVVSIPAGCSNLAMSVNVVLYDRLRQDWMEE